MYAVLLLATLFAIYAVVTEQTNDNMNSLSRQCVAQESAVVNRRSQNKGGFACM